MFYVQRGSAFKNSTFCPHTVFMCFVWITEQTAITSLYSINWLVFITETDCVYSAIRAESLRLEIVYLILVLNPYRSGSSVVGLSPRRARFEPWPVYVKLCGGQCSTWSTSLSYHRCSVFFILKTAVTRKTNVWSLGTFKTWCREGARGVVSIFGEPLNG
jgi:hypothetical protein